MLDWNYHINYRIDFIAVSVELKKKSSVVLPLNGWIRLPFAVYEISFVKRAPEPLWFILKPRTSVTRKIEVYSFGLIRLNCASSYRISLGEWDSLREQTCDVV